jgi:hypothetical protein
MHLESLAAERFCELALVFLLFSDSTRIDLAGLRRHLGWPSRLLLIGLPLTMLAGLGAARKGGPDGLAELQVTAARTVSGPQPFVPSEHVCPVWLRTARCEPLPAGDPPCGAPPGTACDPA